jgi:hypothetical protein
MTATGTHELCLGGALEDPGSIRLRQPSIALSPVLPVQELVQVSPMREP